MHSYLVRVVCKRTAQRPRSLQQNFAPFHWAIIEVSSGQWSPDALRPDSWRWSWRRNRRAPVGRRHWRASTCRSCAEQWQVVDRVCARWNPALQLELQSDEQRSLKSTEITQSHNFNFIEWLKKTCTSHVLTSMLLPPTAMGLSFNFGLSRISTAA